MSWAPMVQVGNDPKYYTNQLRYATREEAEEDARNLSQRWTAVRAWRAEERPEDEPNRRWDAVRGSVYIDEQT